MKNQVKTEPTTTVIYPFQGVNYSRIFKGILSRSEAERQLLFQAHRHVPASAIISLTVTR